MARRPRLTSGDLLIDLAKKAAILEQELVTQRLALERLKELGVPPSRPPHSVAPPPRRTI